MLKKFFLLVCSFTPLCSCALDSVLQNKIDLCNKQNSEACYFIGDSYYWGDGVKQDYKLANEYFDKACSLDHLIGCTALTYMTPLLKEQKPQKITSELNLMDPKEFESIRAEFASPNSLFVKLMTSSLYSDLDKDKVDLIKKAVSLYLGNKRLAWIVYNDLKKNRVINENTSPEQFWQLFSQRAGQITEYLFTRYQKLLKDDEIINIVTFNKEVLKKVYSSKQYELCKKIVNSNRLSSAEMYLTIKDISSVILTKKLRTQENLLKTVLYQPDPYLNEISLKNKELLVSQTTAEKLLEDNFENYLTHLSDEEISKVVYISKNLNTADSKAVCEFGKNLLTEVIFKDNQSMEDTRLLFLISLNDVVSADPSLLYLDEEISKMKKIGF